jgi:hypothetical protein
MHMLQSLFYLTIALHVSGIIITDPSVLTFKNRASSI